MYYIFSVLAGVVIATMVSINGGLTSAYGNYVAAVIIHVVGVLFAFLLCIILKEDFRIKKGIPVWAYFGGGIGVLTTLFNNYAFGRISMTSIIALGLLGQSLSSVLLDSLGWLGLSKIAIKKSSMIGYFTALIGIIIMMDNTISDATIAVLLSLGAGVTVVLSRTINARFANQTSPLIGSLINHVTGLPICIFLVFCIQDSFRMTSISNAAINTPFWMYIGGVFGVLSVLIFNIIVPKVPAFQVSLLSFTGQIFTGIILDIAFASSYSVSTFIGGLVIAIGLTLNMFLEHRSKRKNNYSSIGNTFPL